jgi:hypothetical protein
MPPRDDTLTLVALGVLAFVVANLSHEALGHGLAALAVGAKPVMLTTCYFRATGNTSRWIPAGGGIANVVVGLLCFFLLRLLRTGSSHFRYFLVLVVAFNLFFAAGYPAYSGIAAFGDWADVTSGLTPRWLGRVLLVIISVISYYVSLELVASVIRPYCGTRSSEGLARLRRLTLVPYLSSLGAASLAAALNPTGWTVVFTSGLPAAAAAFGLTQMDHVPRACCSDSNVTMVSSITGISPITRSYAWIAAGSVVLGLFVGVLGPGIRFR